MARRVEVRQVALEGRAGGVETHVELRDTSRRQELQRWVTCSWEQTDGPEILDLIESKMDEIEAGDSARAAATVARVARNAASAERKAKREASALKVPSERTWSRSLSGGSRGGSEQPSWLEAAGLRVEAAEAWMDNLVASRSASTAVDLGVESFLEPVESPGESPPAPASAVAGSSEKGKDKPRSRKVSFADDAAAAE